MSFNVTVDRISQHDSDQSSISEEEGSSGVQVSPPSDPGSHDYHDPYDEWAHLSYPDELKPSDSASRPRTSHRSRTRTQTHGSHSASGRRSSSRRHVVHDRGAYSQRPRHRHSPESLESPDSAEEFAGDAYAARVSRERRIWPQVAPGAAASYAPSFSSGPSYNVYAQGPMPPHAPFMHPGAAHVPSDQLVRFGHPGQPGHPATPYAPPPFAYGPQFPQPHGAALPPVYLPEAHSARAAQDLHQRSQARARGDGRPGFPPSMPHVAFPRGLGPYAASPMAAHDLAPYGAPGTYYPFREQYPVGPGLVPPAYFAPYVHPGPAAQPPGTASSTTTEAAADGAKDEAIARLEKLILDERTEREAKEAARLAALEKEAAEKAAKEEQAAHDKKIAAEAAALARADAEKKAAEAAAKAKKEAEEAASAAAATAAAAEAAAAAAAAASKKPPPEKKKPIKFKDAVGRKFSFPFELCCTWQGMEELIRQAFLHVEAIGPHVAEGHYDLVGPNGDIILPQVWETVIEPDWTITMHMWPIPEKPKSPDPAVPPPPPGAPDAGASPNDIIAIVDGSKKKSESAGAKKPRQRPAEPSPWALWMTGNSRSKTTKAQKAGKKPQP